MVPAAENRRAPSEPGLWLFKSEPSAYSIDDLKRDRTELWDGVRNYQVRNMMRDQMRIGDKFFFYHSSCAAPAVVGLGRISGAAIPDPTQFDSKERYFDPKSSPSDPRWLCVEVTFVAKAKTPCTLARMRAEPALAGMALLARGSRLSILPVLPAHWDWIEGQLQA